MSEWSKINQYYAFQVLRDLGQIAIQLETIGIQTNHATAWELREAYAAAYFVLKKNLEGDSNDPPPDSAPDRPH